MDYVFKKVHKNYFEVTLCGYFVGYSESDDEKEMDNYLFRRGFNSREEFVFGKGTQFNAG